MDFLTIPFQEVVRAAEGGDAESAFQLGICYAHAYEVEQDYAQAVKWFQKSADQGHAGALDRLGICYATGRGVEQDNVEAVKLFRRASELGNPLAQFNLGLALVLGQGTEVNYLEAYVWFSLSAAQGDLMAMESRTQVAEQLSGRELIEAEETTQQWISRLAQRLV